MNLTREHCYLYLGIVFAYAIYMISHNIAGATPPDGLILSGIVGIGAALAGVKAGILTEQKKRISEGHEDTEIDV